MNSQTMMTGEKSLLRVWPIVSVLLLLVSFCACSNEDVETRPNILLLVADDLGYSDLGVYGGEIRTPNIDGLASQGLLFSRYHSGPSCAPTRVMLFSGNDNHVAGMGWQGRRSSDWGYENAISERVAIIPELLKEKGYHTYIAGKWHIGYEPQNNPAARGFEKSFVNLAGAGTHYDQVGFDPEEPVTPYTENGRTIRYPTGEYTTELYTNKIMEYIGENLDDNSPFFASVTYTSPHWPLQVPDEYLDKYSGVYDGGYEELRKRRLDELKRLDLIPDQAILPEMHSLVTPWDSLSGENRMREARKMELYAAMVENLDFHIGRLIRFLIKEGVYDNTMIIFISDNGAAAEDFYNRGGFVEHVRRNFNNDYTNMGLPSSFVSYGPQWAEAGSAPFRYYKGYATEGGLVAPAIISGYGVERKGEVWDGFATVQDIAPTIYDLAGIRYPSEFRGREIYPVKGSSMAPMLASKTDSVHSATEIWAVEQNNHIAVHKGNWKLVNTVSPLDSANWELYDLSNDLSESHNLMEDVPDIAGEMLQWWEKYREESRILVPPPVID